MARSLPPIPTCRFRQFLNMAYHGSQYASITQIPFFPFVHQHVFMIYLRGENYISSKKTRTVRNPANCVNPTHDCHWTTGKAKWLDGLGSCCNAFCSSCFPLKSHRGIAPCAPGCDFFIPTSPSSSPPALSPHSSMWAFASHGCSSFTSQHLFPILSFYPSSTIFLPPLILSDSVTTLLY